MAPRPGLRPNRAGALTPMVPALVLGLVAAAASQQQPAEKSGALPTEASVVSVMRQDVRLLLSVRIRIDISAIMQPLARAGSSLLHFEVVADSASDRKVVFSDDRLLRSPGRGVSVVETTLSVLSPSSAYELTVTVDEPISKRRGRTTAAIPGQSPPPAEPTPRPTPDVSGPALPVVVSIERVEKRAGRLHFVLNVRTDVAAILEPLARAGAADLHVEIVSRSQTREDSLLSADRRVPFQDVDSIVVPFEVACPGSASEILVTVEERSSNRRGKASVTIPQIR